MERTQFETLMLAIAGLNTKVDQGFARSDKGLSEIKRSLDLIARQISRTVDDVAAITKRVAKLDGPTV